MASLQIVPIENGFETDLALTNNEDPFIMIGHIIFNYSGIKNLDDYVKKCIMLCKKLELMAIDLEEYVEQNQTEGLKKIGLQIIKSYYDVLKDVKEKYKYNFDKSFSIKDKLNEEIAKINQSINYYVKHPEYFMPDESSEMSNFFAEWFTRNDKLEIMRENTFRKIRDQNTTKKLEYKETLLLENNRSDILLIENGSAEIEGQEALPLENERSDILLIENGSAEIEGQEALPLESNRADFPLIGNWFSKFKSNFNISCKN